MNLRFWINYKGQLLTYDHLARQITGKDKLLTHYRARLPEWEIWLLLATDIHVLKSVEIPADLTDWRFNFQFDRVLLMPWIGGVVELGRQ